LLQVTLEHVKWIKLLGKQHTFDKFQLKDCKKTTLNKGFECENLLIKSSHSCFWARVLSLRKTMHYPSLPPPP